MFIGDDSTSGHRKQTSEMRYERTPTSFMKVEEHSEARRRRVLIWAHLFEHIQPLYHKSHTIHVLYK